MGPWARERVLRKRKCGGRDSEAGWDGEQREMMWEPLKCKWGAGWPGTCAWERVLACVHRWEGHRSRHAGADPHPPMSGQARRQASRRRLTGLSWTIDGRRPRQQVSQITCGLPPFSPAVLLRILGNGVTQRLRVCRGIWPPPTSHAPISALPRVRSSSSAAVLFVFLAPIGGCLSLNAKWMM